MTITTSEMKAEFIRAPIWKWVLGGTVIIIGILLGVIWKQLQAERAMFQGQMDEMQDRLRMTSGTVTECKIELRHLDRAVRRLEEWSSDPRRRNPLDTNQ